MPAVYFDELIEIGATYRVALILLDGSGDPYQLLDVTDVHFNVKKTYESDDTLVHLNFANGGTKITPLEGRIDIEITATETAALPYCDGVYDLKLFLDDGQVIRLRQGRMKISREVQTI